MQPELELYKEYNKQDDICERWIRGCSNYTGMLLCSASHEPVTKSLTLENENECEQLYLIHTTLSTMLRLITNYFEQRQLRSLIKTTR